MVVISRKGENNYGNLNKHTDASVIVNATPVGMYPNTGVSPVELDLFPALEGVLDIVYNPSRTQLLLDAERKGLITENGLWMLVAQAKESAEWFTDRQINDDRIGKIHEILRKQMENIVLVGMPGCGKSTVGGMLAALLHKKFVDIDAEIVKQAGMSIPEIFQKSGEDGFREWETQVLTQIGKESGLVIATGGGAVTRSENYPLVHQNGRIVWLKRSIHSLPTDDRPLSQKNRLEEMYAVRKPMYEAFSDCAVVNDGDLNETVKQILEVEGYQ